MSTIRPRRALPALVLLMPLIPGTIAVDAGEEFVDPEIEVPGPTLALAVQLREVPPGAQFTPVTAREPIVGQTTVGWVFVKDTSMLYVGFAPALALQAHPLRELPYPIRLFPEECVIEGRRAVVGAWLDAKNATAHVFELRLNASLDEPVLHLLFSFPRQFVQSLGVDACDSRGNLVFSHRLGFEANQLAQASGNPAVRELFVLRPDGKGGYASGPVLKDPSQMVVQEVFEREGRTRLLVGGYGSRNIGGFASADDHGLLLSFDLEEGEVWRFSDPPRTERLNDAYLGCHGDWNEEAPDIVAISCGGPYGAASAFAIVRERDGREICRHERVNYGQLGALRPVVHVEQKEGADGRSVRVFDSLSNGTLQALAPVEGPECPVLEKLSPPQALEGDRVVISPVYVQQSEIPGRHDVVMVSERQRQVDFSPNNFQFEPENLTITLRWGNVSSQAFEFKLTGGLQRAVPRSFLGTPALLFVSSESHPTVLLLWPTEASAKTGTPVPIPVPADAPGLRWIWLLVGLAMLAMLALWRWQKKKGIFQLAGEGE